MKSTTSALSDIERRRISALVQANLAIAGPLHAENYQLITPNGSEMTKSEYLNAIETGKLKYHIFEPVSKISMLGETTIVVLRYRARISINDKPSFTCWHTDCYQLLNEKWQVVWSQATQIIKP
jgi:hypothetical protein